MRRNSLLLFFFFSVAAAFSQQHAHTDLPRSLIIELPQQNLKSMEEEEVRLLGCSSWRVAGEANNLSPWKTIPEECVDYVKDYINGPSYQLDLHLVSDEAARYASSIDLNTHQDGMDAWIFDIDETLLSNLPYYAKHAYGSEVFDHNQFDKWVVEGMASAIEPSLKLYNEVLRLGFKIFLLTGRSEDKRDITVDNLINAGFQKWDRLILRAAEDHGKTAVAFKSEKRKEMVEEGFRIHGNTGDQWSDLIGSYISVKSFKLSNPMYYIS